MLMQNGILYTFENVLQLSSSITHVNVLTPNDNEKNFAINDLLRCTKLRNFFNLPHSLIEYCVLFQPTLLVKMIMILDMNIVLLHTESVYGHEN